MTIEKTSLDGVYIINNFNSEDIRGTFVKTFNKNFFEEKYLNLDVRELYYSISNKNVIRGMHFQLPPHDHEKLVFVPVGSIIDVVVDLRKSSSTYKMHTSVELSSENKRSIYIPKGLAHGFKSLTDQTVTVYNVTSEYSRDEDEGIHFNSFGFDWDVNDPIISNRDLNFRSLESFCLKNPF